MKVGIIGAGFTGLSAGFSLSKKGHTVTIFEKDTNPGGLAIGYKEKNWNWTLEQHYHHWFTNDTAVLSLAKEINYPVLTKRPKTSVFLDGKPYQLDSIGALLRFSKLSLLEKFRMAAVLGFLKLNPFWKPLEKINASTFLPKAMGEKGYKLIWEPQLKNKMGKYADTVSLVWFWTRIYKRTSSLAYPAKGYLPFAEHIAKKIKELGGTILYNTETILIKNENEKVLVTTKDKNGKEQTQLFDKVLVTLPSFLFLKLTPSLPQNYKDRLKKLQGLGATNLILRLKKPFLTDGTYWLSICEKDSPVLVIVEHTNFMDKKNFDGEHIVYLGNYPEVTSKKFISSKKDLLQMYDPLLKRVNPEYKKNIIGYEVFKAPFAQPIIPTNYSHTLPSFITPLPNIYLANIEQVYPWDRGTNYAVELGRKIIPIMLKK